MPVFEFDSAKSQANLAKHGIDFDAIEAPARADGEQRFLVVGKIGDRAWTAVITHRGEAVRIISIRRSRTEEVRRYEGH